MTNPITQMPKPEASKYKDSRKLFLVPLFLIPPNAPDDGQQLLEQYWFQIRDHVENLERSLGKVTHVYHEMIFSEAEEGLEIIDQLNPRGCFFVHAMCHSEARLEATDDRALLEEIADWQRCLGLGLLSQKVLSTALEGYQETSKRRFEHIGARIDETLKDGQAGVLFIREDHRIQFPPDIQVFYVAPPTLDALKRWIDEQARAATKRHMEAQQDTEPEQDAQPDQPVEGEQPDVEK